MEHSYWSTVTVCSCRRPCCIAAGIKMRNNNWPHSVPRRCNEMLTSNRPGAARFFLAAKTLSAPLANHTIPCRPACEPEATIRLAVRRRGFGSLFQHRNGSPQSTRLPPSRAWHSAGTRSTPLVSNRHSHRSCLTSRSTCRDERDRADIMIDSRRRSRLQLSPPGVSSADLRASTVYDDSRLIWAWHASDQGARSN